MLASVFVTGGLDAARHPASKAPAAENVNASAIAESVGLSSTEQLVRANGIAQVVGGVCLATGRLPRLAALGLAASLVPTTAAGHRFWEADDAATKKMQQLHFLKNLSILGGLLIAAVDTGGKESVGHKVSRRTQAVVESLPTRG
ncbi:MAG TPA: DoxX family protein [Mycobacteriales bacterium]|nr:DoxX family protein [Mycobacteriales bacterium]